MSLLSCTFLNAKASHPKSNRLIIKENHERFQVNLLLRQLKYNNRANYIVTSAPEPPDALITTGTKNSWVELITVYWSAAYAKDLHSYANPNETHMPIKKGPYVNMDQNFARQFVKDVQNKLSKESYLQIKEQRGPGYLLVAVKFPFFSPGTFDSIRSEWATSKFSDLGCFRSVYLTVPQLNDYAVIRWSPPLKA